MRLARVIGNVVATRKEPALEGKKLLLIQPLDRRLRPAGRPLVALDSVGAGAGEVVYYTRGKEGGFAFLPEKVAADAGIVGIVDCVDYPEEGVHFCCH